MEFLCLGMELGRGRPMGPSKTTKSRGGRGRRPLPGPPGSGDKGGQGILAKPTPAVAYACFKVLGGGLVEIACMGAELGCPKVGGSDTSNSAQLAPGHALMLQDVSMPTCGAVGALLAALEVNKWARVSFP